jgi:5-oxoprolinase (ATP-hydrolysing)
MTASILSNRRRIPPRGIRGGGDAPPGVNRVIRGGREELLGATASVEMQAGDTIVIETPGGGGFGEVKA